MRYLILIAMLIPVVACAGGQKSETPKSPLNYANGENYNADVAVGTVPVKVSSKDRWTTLNGKIVFTNPTFDPSTGIQNVQLLKKDKVVAQTNTSADGAFQLKGKFDNGDYQLKVNSKTLVGTISLTIKDYEMNNIVLPATLTSPQ